MPGKQVHRAPGVLLGGEPEAHLGRGDRDELVRGLDHARGVQAEHGHGRFGPQPLRDRSRAHQADARSQRGLLPVLLLGELQALPRPVRQTLDRDRPVVVVQRGKDPGKRRDRVDRRSAVGPAVAGQVERADRDDAVDDATDARLERRDAGPPVPAVGHADHVGRQELLVPADQERQVLGARLLLALDQDLDGHRRLAFPGPHRGRVHDDTALVVGRPAPVQTPVPHLGLERRARPLLERSLGLDVVVCVEQDRRRSGGPATSPKTAGWSTSGSSIRRTPPYPAASRVWAVASAASGPACRRNRGTRSRGCGRGSTVPRRHEGAIRRSRRGARRRAWGRTIPSARATDRRPYGEPRAVRARAVRRARPRGRA